MRSIKQSVIVVAALLALSMAAFHGNAGAQALPTWINYQGRLTSPIGAPVVDGPYTVTFKLYATPTGGSPLWTEVQNQVTTRNGLFSTTLGKITAFPAGLFTRPLYLEIVVADKILSPRQELGTVPFAMSALSFPSNGVTTAMIANLAVTTEKIADGAITEAKMAPGVAVPIGAVVSWWGNSGSTPNGWQLCDGSTVTDTQSPLKGLVLPDLRDRFVRGATGNVRASAQTGGQDQITLSVDQMPRHSHGVIDPGHSHAINGIPGWGAGPQNAGLARTDGNSPQNAWAMSISSATTGISISEAGGGNAVAIVPRFVGLVYIIRVK